MRRLMAGPGPRGPAAGTAGVVHAATVAVGPAIQAYKESSMNNIVYIVGAVVIVLAILSFIGLR